jgi:hypothetical protein
MMMMARHDVVPTAMMRPSMATSVMGRVVTSVMGRVVTSVMGRVVTSVMVTIVMLGRCGPRRHSATRQEGGYNEKMT